MKLNYDDLNVKGQNLSRFLDTVGDGTGSIDMEVDGSVTPVEFYLTAQPGYIYVLHRLIFFISAGGSIDSGGFGNGGELTNGIIFSIRRNGVDQIITGQLPITKNVHVAAYCYDIDVHSWGAGDQSLVSRYTFDKDGGSFVLNPGDSFVATVRDDLTDPAGRITEFHVRLGFVSVPK